MPKSSSGSTRVGRFIGAIRWGGPPESAAWCFYVDGGPHESFYSWWVSECDGLGSGVGHDGLPGRSHGPRLAGERQRGREESRRKDETRNGESEGQDGRRRPGRSRR